ncbi:hypothetical protein NLJ89_g1974 [Agrocybe chaxingu]|uniref:Uncharacterized protein n=1 Tax=Agrocybe chaxingu TaxID=84603 RepID=A0A9W8MZ09_9AGAR|nr:hypothetical protein NLJ89_g1974 [Agrocybe chaxingu]
MTEALSLGDEPPPVEFGFLKPMERRSHYNPYKMNDVDPQKMTEPSLNLPMGVRLLLQSWDANDPDEFVYKDPYDESATVDSPKRVNTTPATDFTAYSKRPPLILASVALPLAVIPDISRKLSPPKVQSQDPFMNYPESFPQTEQPGGSESQELLMSTQVLPGPYGGRPAARKKPTKRRLGGF